MGNSYLILIQLPQSNKAKIIALSIPSPSKTHLGKHFKFFVLSNFAICDFPQYFKVIFSEITGKQSFSQMTTGSFINVIRLVSCIASESIQFYFPEGIYLFKVNNGRTRRMCEICSKLIIKIPERHLVYPGNTPDKNWTTIHVTSPTSKNVQKRLQNSCTFMQVLCVFYL